MDKYVCVCTYSLQSMSDPVYRYTKLIVAVLSQCYSKVNLLALDILHVRPFWWETSGAKHLIIMFPFDSLMMHLKALMISIKV